MRRANQQSAQHQYYTLTFSHTFAHDQDKVYFAYSVPYSYSDLTRDLDLIAQDEQRAAYMQRTTLC